MKIPCMSKTLNLRSLTGKALMGLVVATMIGSIEVTPAAAGDHGNGGGYRDDRGYDQRGPRHDRGRHRGRRAYRPRYVEPVYVEPVYVAPPVYYAPPPAPGISIFLPTIHIR